MRETLSLERPGTLIDGHPAKRQRDAEVDDLAAALGDLDPQRPRGWPRGPAHGTGSRIALSSDEPGVGLEGVDDRRGLLGGQAALGHEPEDLVERISHRSLHPARRAAPSPRRRRSRRARGRGGCRGGSPRRHPHPGSSPAPEIAAVAAAERGRHRGRGGLRSPTAAAQRAERGGAGATGAANRPVGRCGPTTRRSPETDRNWSSTAPSPTTSERRPGPPVDACGRSLLRSPATVRAVIRRPPVREQDRVAADGRDRVRPGAELARQADVAARRGQPHAVDASALDRHVAGHRLDGEPDRAIDLGCATSPETVSVVTSPPAVDQAKVARCRPQVLLAAEAAGRDVAAGGLDVDGRAEPGRRSASRASGRSPTTKPSPEATRLADRQAVRAALDLEIVRQSAAARVADPDDVVRDRRPARGPSRPTLTLSRPVGPMRCSTMADVAVSRVIGSSPARGWPGRPPRRRSHGGRAARGSAWRVSPAGAASDAVVVLSSVVVVVAARPEAERPDERPRRGSGPSGTRCRALAPCPAGCRGTGGSSRGASSGRATGARTGRR